MFYKIWKIPFPAQQLKKDDPAPPNVLFISFFIVLSLRSVEDGRVPDGVGDDGRSDSMCVTKANKLNQDTFVFL